MINKIAEAYKRWRHTRGYGVHSPFAYRMVKMVICPGMGYGWYGDAAIDVAADTSEDFRRRKQARMLLRLACFMRTERVYLPVSNRSGLLTTALHCYDSRVRIEKKRCDLEECDMICTHGDHLDKETLCRLISRQGIVIVASDLPEGWPEEIFGSLPAGLMFRGKRNMIAINRPEMQKLCYTISI